MDKYTRNARIYPLLLMILPCIVWILSYSIEYKNIITALSPLGIIAAISYFGSQVIRNYGKQLEPKLWKEWGGMPSAQLFYFKNKVLDYQTKERYHIKMQELDKDYNIQFNKAPFKDVKDIYCSWTTLLISKTRDHEKFSLLFKENINYGFRRNLLGVKKANIYILTFLLFINFLVNCYNRNSSEVSIAFYISECSMILMLLTWKFIVTSSWVKSAAFSYAKRLLETIDQL